MGISFCLKNKIFEKEEGSVPTCESIETLSKFEILPKLRLQSKKLFQYNH